MHASSAAERGMLQHNAGTAGLRFTRCKMASLHKRQAALQGSSRMPLPALQVALARQPVRESHTWTGTSMPWTSNPAASPDFAATPGVRWGVLGVALPTSLLTREPSHTLHRWNSVRTSSCRTCLQGCRHFALPMDSHFRCMVCAPSLALAGNFV